MQQLNFKKDELISKALGLYAMHNFLAHTLHISKDSAKNIMMCLPADKGDQDVPTAVPLIARAQVKNCMREILREETAAALTALEKLLGSNNKTTWGTCFGTIVAIWMGAEVSQVTADLIIVHDILDENATTASSVDDSSKYCHQVDSLPVRYFLQKLHSVRRSHQQRGKGKRKHGWNPIRDGPDPDMDQPSTILAMEISRICHENSKIIQERLELANIIYRGRIVRTGQI
jgi:hypothetical protein